MSGGALALKLPPPFFPRCFLFNQACIVSWIPKGIERRSYRSKRPWKGLPGCAAKWFRSRSASLRDVVSHPLVMARAQTRKQSISLAAPNDLIYCTRRIVTSGGGAVGCSLLGCPAVSMVDGQKLQMSKTAKPQRRPWKWAGTASDPTLDLLAPPVHSP